MFNLQYSFPKRNRNLYKQLKLILIIIPNNRNNSKLMLKYSNLKLKNKFILKNSYLVTKNSNSNLTLQLRNSNPRLNAKNDRL